MNFQIIRRGIITITTLLMFTGSVAGDSLQPSEAEDTSRISHRMTIHFNPVSALVGAIDLNLEGRVTPSVSCFIDGMYTFPVLSETRSYEAGGGVHVYYTDSLFWGLIVKTGKLRFDIPPTDEDPGTYHLKIEYISAGAHWGRIQKLWKLNCFYRIGLCYPFMSKATWRNDQKPGGSRLLELSSRLASYLDTELSILIPLPW